MGHVARCARGSRSRGCERSRLSACLSGGAGLFNISSVLCGVSLSQWVAAKPTVSAGISQLVVAVGRFQVRWIVDNQLDLGLCLVPL
jgi:hypothetical protein